MANRHKDLTGHQVGHLTYVWPVGMNSACQQHERRAAWLAVCVCGALVVIRRPSDKRTSCGCRVGKQRALASHAARLQAINHKDLTNKRRGYLKVVEYSHRVRHRFGFYHYWRCVCVCGKEVVKSGSSLRVPNVSCGCKKKHDWTGRRVGSLTVVRFHGRRKKKRDNLYWACRCDCGNEVIRNVKSLQAGHTASCGCGINRLQNHNPASEKGI